MPPVTYFSSAALQYTSLTNFDQLSSRTWWSAYTGFHVGRIGWGRRVMPSSRGVRSAFRLLQAMQASTQFVQLDTPPCDRGTTWSIVSSSVPGWLPQYWHTYRSRLNTLRRLNVTADCG